MNWTKIIGQVIQLILAILKNYNSEEKEIVITAIKNNPKGVLNDKKHSVRDIASKFNIPLPNQPKK